MLIKDDDSCGNGWICEHRWPAIAQMVLFSIVTRSQPVENWWDNENNQIAFSRGNKGFFAVNNDNGLMRTEIQTRLPPGFYCDIVSGIYTDKVCKGRLVTIQSDGKLYLNLPNSNPGMMALHVGATVSGVEMNPNTSNDSWQRTVILIYKQSERSLFIRGGIGYERRAECKQNNKLCNIPIQHRLNHTTNETFLKLAQEDHILDWNGLENSKDTTSKQTGSPLLRTTNDSKSDSFFDLNNYGADYWALDVEMDCSKTDIGWFEFKVVFKNADQSLQWESQIDQEECNGVTFRAQAPFWSMNHLAMCGKINVFSYDSAPCIIKDF